LTFDIDLNYSISKNNGPRQLSQQISQNLRISLAKIQIFCRIILTYLAKAHTYVLILIASLHLCVFLPFYMLQTITERDRSI